MLTKWSVTVAPRAVVLAGRGVNSAVPVPEQGRSAVVGMSCGVPYSLNVNDGAAELDGPSVATIAVAALPVKPPPVPVTTWTPWPACGWPTWPGVAGPGQIMTTVASAALPLTAPANR